MKKLLIYIVRNVYIDKTKKKYLLKYNYTNDAFYTRTCTVPWIIIITDDLKRRLRLKYYSGVIVLFI